MSPIVNFRFRLVGTFNSIRVKNISEGDLKVWYTSSPEGHVVEASPYMVFNPADITINVLDTIHFQDLGYHDATEVSEETCQDYDQFFISTRADAQLQRAYFDAAQAGTVEEEFPDGYSIPSYFL